MLTLNLFAAVAFTSLLYAAVKLKQRKRLDRANAVVQMNANHAIEDSKPDSSDLAMQAKYVEGKASIADLLAHAREFAKKSAGK